MSEEEQQRKEVFLVNDRECFALSHFYQSKLDFCICFFNCQSCKCGHLSYTYIKRDLGYPTATF